MAILTNAFLNITVDFVELFVNEYCELILTMKEKIKRSNIRCFGHEVNLY